MSENSYSSRVEITSRLCRCGRSASCFTAETRHNYGRRFYKCPLAGVSSCGFWEWRDDCFPTQAERIITIYLLKVFGGTMAIGMKQMSMIIATLGVLSFIFGVIAENKKPAAGTAIPGKGVVICKYGSDPTVALGYLSFVFLAASSIAGVYSLYYPYQGKSIPKAALLRNNGLFVFFSIALGLTGLAAAMLLWPTITEQLHITHNVHHNLQTDCPTAKTGLLGGGAFLSLDSALFWLVALMLADNAREDYFQDPDVTDKLAVSYAADEVIKTSA